MSRIVVVAPHPDDEVIGCGGSLVKHARAGHAITVITISRRVRSRVEEDITDADYRIESESAHRILGVRRHVALDLPGRSPSATEVTAKLVTEFRINPPEILYVPHDNESDADHRQTNTAALEALWMAQSLYFNEQGPAISPPQLVLGYEIWTPLSRFQYVEDIGDDAIEKKVEAMQCYRSQMRHAPWDAAIRGLASYRGVTTRGGGHAEVFAVLHMAEAGSARPADY